MSLNTQTRQTYRAILRELPRLSLSNPTPLHRRLRDLYRTNQTADEDELRMRLQTADQMAQYARAQRSYVALLDRYNPGMTMDEEERIRLTARRVGWDLPVTPGSSKE
ncbi:hypothetical protein BDV25DRAFT_163036 [Aspergillus avenaceus]|uniref:Ras guanyl-nucleotide exchange factor RasGEF n=1 Tax=Aspergillus avenaceus TaxID=36643 RepID=A0A5N6TIJ1_ASPAV|nr:hypothetical protein BDV25DRAFT_163036 [Aspergillus avenaceus]